MGFFTRLRTTLTGQPGNAIEDEIAFHIEQRADELIAQGLLPKDAQRQARREFGNPGKWRDETRDADVFVMLENLLRDTRQSLRGLRKRPAFTLTAMGSLAIGIGAIASLFAVADAVIWKPIGLPQSEQLYDIQEAKRGELSNSNGPRLKDWQMLKSISGATGSYGESLVWRSAEGSQVVRCLRTYTGLMATSRPTVAIGRGFTPEEESGTADVALATHSFWRNQLHSGPLGTLEISGKTYQLIGVLDTSVAYPDNTELWIPAPPGLQAGPRGASYLGVTVRLKPGVPIEQAQAEVKLAAARLAQAYPQTDAGLTAWMVPLQEALTHDARSGLFALLSVAACVLAMICVNVAALLLSRGAEREREAALRSALGASAASLIRLYLMEAVLLALGGGLLGTLFALTAVDLLKQILPAQLPRLADSTVDARVIGFALLVSLIAALASGLVPAWLAGRRRGLHDSARGSASGAGGKRIRTAFVVVEIALSVVLVTTGVRLGQAFLELSSRPAGFPVNGLLTVTIPFPWTVKEARLHGFTERALERFRTLPGVTRTALVDQYPLLGGTQDRDVRVEGIETNKPIHAGFRLASAGYFDIMKVRVLEGRLFDPRHKPEFVVNEAFARRYFTNGRPAATQRVAFGTANDWYDVVGVISNLRQTASKADAEPELFCNYSADYWPYLNFVLETQTPAAVLAPLLREEAARLDPTVIIKSILPMKDKLADSSKDSRIRSLLVGASAALALLLMAIGIHGLIAGDVSTRWREFGVRLALGATVPSLRLLLLGKIGTLAVIGLLGGIGVVIATTNLLAHSFEGLPPLSPLTLAVVGIAIAVAALTAIAWPLYRLAGIDPATALRHE